MKSNCTIWRREKFLVKWLLGNIPPDTIITQGVLFHVFTGEFIKKQSIGVNDKALMEPRKVFFEEERCEMGGVVLPFEVWSIFQRSKKRY